MKSMTGYACIERRAGDSLIEIEIKSVNSRFFDFSVSVPFWLCSREKGIRDFFKGKVSRGKVDVAVRVREEASRLAVRADIEAAKAYSSALAEVAAAIGCKSDIPLSLVAAQEGVLQPERKRDDSLYDEAIAPLLQEALDQFDRSRSEEGAALKLDILAMAQKIEAALSAIETRAPSMQAAFREGITARFAEMLGAITEDDKRRILQEVAVLLAKYTINEEIVRLRSHLSVLKNELEANPEPGKKIDFICQEINREANTIASKTQDFETAQAVISIKDALENIREQARNIE